MRRPAPRNGVAAVGRVKWKPASSARSAAKREVAHRAAPSRHARDVVVVQQHRHAVAREVHVGLDHHRAVRDAALERGERVLGHLARAAAVPDRERAAQVEERVRASAYGIMRRPMTRASRR